MCFVDMKLKICVKFMWLGMKVLADARKVDETKHLDFWICFDKNMPSILNGTSDGDLFKIWLMNALIKLYEQNRNTKSKHEQPLVPLSVSHTAIDDSVKNFLKSAKTEMQVRTLLVLLNPVISELCPERIETLITVWDYFSVRLH